MIFIKHFKRALLITLGLILVCFTVAFMWLSNAYTKTIESYPIETTVSNLRVSDNYCIYEDISEIFLDSIVAVEDRRFYSHGAVDIIGTGRAFVTNILSREIEQGGSTITQQLAKNLFLSHEQTIERKLKEMFIAHRLEELYSKDEILELYVNIINYGDGNIGIKMASKNYFDSSPIELSFDEATLLAGLPQAPSAYALSNNYDLALERQEQVIEALEEFTSDYDDYINTETN